MTYSECVLILILLEYGLQHHEEGVWIEDCVVLILILLEYGLQQKAVLDGRRLRPCLNPYSTGIWSATKPGPPDGVLGAGS